MPSSAITGLSKAYSRTIPDMIRWYDQYRNCKEEDLTSSLQAIYDNQQEQAQLGRSYPSRHPANSQ